MSPALLGASHRIPERSQFFKRIGGVSGARFWYHDPRNAFIAGAERNLMLPSSRTSRLVNHTPPNHVAQTYGVPSPIGEHEAENDC